MVRHGLVVDYALDGRQDPSLSPRGRRQAEALAVGLGRVGITPPVVASSPYRRALETAAPIAATTGVEVEVVDAVGEVVPRGTASEERGPFLRAFMAGRWADQEQWLLEWREDVLSALVLLARRGDDTVVVSHFVAINVAVGAAQGDDRTTVFRPSNTSVNSFEVDGDGRFHVVGLNGAAHLDGLAP